MGLALAAAVGLLCLFVNWSAVGPIFLMQPTVTRQAPLLCAAAPARSSPGSSPTLPCAAPLCRRAQPYQLAYPSKTGCGYELNQGEWTSAPLTVG